jgi:hypothetical protein
MEYASPSRGVHHEVLADLRAVEAARGRPDLVGHRYVKVIRDANGQRRVVPAPDAAGRRVSTPPNASRLSPAQRLAAYDQQLKADRARRLATAERECFPARSRERRLKAAEDEIFCELAARRGGPLLRPVYGASR